MFKGVEVLETKYIVNKKLPVDVRYQIRNGQVIIDLKALIDGVLDAESISKYKTDKVTLNIPFDMSNQVTGNSMNLVMDKRRFTLRLSTMEVIPSKQQKIDYDNTHAHRWKLPQWIKLIEDLFYQTYGFKAMELDLRAASGGVRRGKVFGQIKSLRDKILGAEGFHFNEDSVVEYLRWAFTSKGAKGPLSLGLLQSDSMIQEWLIKKKADARRSGTTEKRTRKWDG
jgi:hypothetical protein